jgi:hypothetical protein
VVASALNLSNRRPHDGLSEIRDYLSGRETSPRFEATSSSTAVVVRQPAPTCTPEYTPRYTPELTPSSTHAAKACGVRMGRKPKLTDHQRQETRRRLESCESVRTIGKSFGVHHAAVLGAL